MKITDSPYAAGTPEHDHWVRTQFIPGVGRDRWDTDRARYGAASIGARLTRVLDSDDEPELWPANNPYLSAAAAAKRLGGAFDDLGAQFKALFMQTWGFSDEEIKRSQDRDRRQRLDAMWVDVPEWQWRWMYRDLREGLGRVRVWQGGPGGHFDYYDRGEKLPVYGPPRPNRAERRYTRLPPLRPQRLCPIHGGAASQCRRCMRSFHA